ALRSRVFPQVVREDLAPRHLIHLPEPAALGVLFPFAPVPAGTQKQLAQVGRRGLHAIRHGRVSWLQLGHGLPWALGAAGRLAALRTKRDICQLWYACSRGGGEISMVDKSVTDAVRMRGTSALGRAAMTTQEGAQGSRGGPD